MVKGDYVDFLEELGIYDGNGFFHNLKPDISIRNNGLSFGIFITNLDFSSSSNFSITSFIDYGLHNTKYIIDYGSVNYDYQGEDENEDGIPDWFTYSEKLNENIEDTFDSISLGLGIQFSNILIQPTITKIEDIDNPFYNFYGISQMAYHVIFTFISSCY